MIIRISLNKHFSVKYVNIIINYNQSFSRIILKSEIRFYIVLKYCGYNNL